MKATSSRRQSAPVLQTPVTPPVSCRGRREGDLAYEAMPKSQDTPLIFLDIDGVIFIPAREEPMTVLGLLVAEMAKAAKAEIVISSTWRSCWTNLVERNTGGVGDFVKSLPDSKVTMRTKEFPRNNLTQEEQRAKDILHWFEYPARAGISYKWIALDDLELHSTQFGPRLDGHFVYVNGNIGMVPQLVVKGLKLLQQQGSEIDEQCLSDEVRECWRSAKN